MYVEKSISDGVKQNRYDSSSLIAFKLSLQKIRFVVQCAPNLNRLICWPNRKTNIHIRYVIPTGIEPYLQGAPGKINKILIAAGRKSNPKKPLAGTSAPNFTLINASCILSLCLTFQEFVVTTFIKISRVKKINSLIQYRLYGGNASASSFPRVPKTGDIRIHANPIFDTSKYK